MTRVLLFSLPLLAVAGAACAQPADPHAHHRTPAPAAKPAADPHAQHRAPAAQPAPDPHAHHRAPAAQPAPDPHAGHAPATPAPADPHAGHGQTGADLPVGNAPPPLAVAATLADGVWDRTAMARSRVVLKAEHGGMTYWNVVLDRLEARPAKGADGYAWEGWARYGGDIDRLVVKTEGEGRHGVEAAEVQAVYSRAIGPYFDLQAGLRQDFEPASRTYATVGVSGLAPYWFEVEAAAYLSDKGELSARLEAEYDLRLTNRLILQPAAEVTLADDSSAELGLRLRYDIRREFAPYVGVHHEKTFGGGSETRAVVGLRLAY
jgi:copper resistance protein B